MMYNMSYSTGTSYIRTGTRHDPIHKKKDTRATRNNDFISRIFLNFLGEMAIDLANGNGSDISERLFQSGAAFPRSTTCSEPDTATLHCCCFAATTSNHVRHPRHLRLTSSSSRAEEQAHPMLPAVRIPGENVLATLGGCLVHAWSCIVKHHASILCGRISNAG